MLANEGEEQGHEAKVRKLRGLGGGSLRTLRLQGFSQLRSYRSFLVKSYNFLFPLLVLGFELRALCLLGICSTT
jgi:hypothetical protein